MKYTIFTHNDFKKNTSKGVIEMKKNGKTFRQFVFPLNPQEDDAILALPYEVGRKVHDGEDLTAQDIKDSVALIKQERNSQVLNNNFLKSFKI